MFKLIIMIFITNYYNYSLLYLFYTYTYIIILLLIIIIMSYKPSHEQMWHHSQMGHKQQHFYVD